MAKVRMTKGMSESYFQESWDFVYEYTYCDKCGSFDLGVTSKLPMNLDKVLVIAIVVSFVTMSVIAIIVTSIWFLGLLISFVGLIALVLYKTITSQLVCNKCRNVSFSARNILNYAQNDTSVIDIPEEKIFKRHIETIRTDP